jgi:hypothetical protein
MINLYYIMIATHFSFMHTRDKGSDGWAQVKYRTLKSSWTKKQLEDAGVTIASSEMKEVHSHPLSFSFPQTVGRRFFRRGSVSQTEFEYTHCLLL